MSLKYSIVRSEIDEKMIHNFVDFYLIQIGKLAQQKYDLLTLNRASFVMRHFERIMVFLTAIEKNFLTRQCKQ